MLTVETRAQLFADCDVDPARCRGRARWRALDRRGQWFYKRLVAVPSVTRWPCPWSELLCAALLERLGLPHLEATLIHIQREREWVLRLPAVQRVLPGAVVAAEARPAAREDRVLLDAGLLPVFLFDILVGNGDRSFHNLFLAPAPGPCIPIDHELALSTPAAVRPDSSYFHFVAPETADLLDGGAHRRALVRRRGTASAIAEANLVYGRLCRGLDERAGPVAEWIGHARRRITERWFRSCVDAVPAEMFVGDPARERDYLCRTMHARLAHLPALLAACRAPAG